MLQNHVYYSLAHEWTLICYCCRQTDHPANHRYQINGIVVWLHSTMFVF